MDPYETSFTWAATPTQPWLTVTPASGEATDGFTVCAHLSGKVAGMYAGTVSVTVTGSVTSTLSLPVVMTVEAGGATCGGTAIAPQVLAATGTTTPKVSQSGVTIAFPVRNPNAAQRTYNWTATTNNAAVASPTTASGTLNVPGGATANASVVYSAGTHFSETATLGITVTDASAGSLSATGSASVHLQAPFLGSVTPATAAATSVGTYYLTFNYTNNTAVAQTVNILPGGYDNALESSWGLTTSGTGQSIGPGATNSIVLGFDTRAGVTGTLTHTFAVGLTSDGSLNAGALASGVINVNTVVPNQAPAASVSCTTVYAGQASRCTMTGSDPDGDALTASTGWTLLTTNTWYKDVTSGTPGTQQVCGTVTDSHAATSTQACGTATWSNRTPTASFTAAPNPTDNATAVAFNASASSDPDGDALTYSWAFGDGQSASGVTSSHLYAAGNYTATLSVSDGRGGTNSTTRSISVAVPNRAPSASVSCTSVYAGQVSRCTMTASDPDGDALTGAAGWTLLTTNTWYKDLTSAGPGTQSVCGSVTDSRGATSPQGCGTAIWNADQITSTTYEDDWVDAGQWTNPANCDLWANQTHYRRAVYHWASGRTTYGDWQDMGTFGTTYLGKDPNCGPYVTGYGSETYDEVYGESECFDIFNPPFKYLYVQHYTRTVTYWSNGSVDYGDWMPNGTNSTQTSC